MIEELFSCPLAIATSAEHEQENGHIARGIVNVGRKNLRHPSDSPLTSLSK